MTATPMTDGESLRRAILAAPDDDAPRRVYGDWLREQGQWDRAEFIDVQCELALFERWCDDPDFRIDLPRRSDIDALRRREGELFIDLYVGGDSFVDADATSLGRDGVTYQFRRGFIAHVAADLATLIGGDGCGCEIDMDNPDEPCPICGGSGVWPGILTALLQREPVTSARAVDKHPEHTVRGPGLPEWTWFVGDVLSRTSAAHITNELWRLMWSSWYPTEDAAHQALSTALIRYAREAAT